MRLAWAFFQRDARIALSYRAAFVMQFVGNMVLVALMFYVGKALGSQPLPALARYGGSFLAYVLIGIALTDCVLVSLMSFASQVREAQTTGTLEATLMSPVSLTSILIYSSLWNYFMSAIRFLLYLGMGALVFGVELGHSNLLAALVVFILTVVCFMGFGILWAGLVLTVKRGEGIISVIGYFVMLATGVFFPVALLPKWLQLFGSLIPLTYALEGMRFALLQGSGLTELAPIIGRLTIFAVVLLCAGIAGFNFAVNAARQSGSLTQY
jgi:ABC-2 type transport system permease protein